MMYRCYPPAYEWHGGDAGNDHGGPATTYGGASETTPDAMRGSGGTAATPPTRAAVLVVRSRSPALSLVPPFASSVLRMAASHACASIDSVIWRYQLLQWRTS